MKPLRFYGGVFLVTASVLMLQIVQTRILSVVLWYYLAFFVISIAMFGLTAGAVWVFLRGDRFTARTLSYDLAYYSSALGIAVAIGAAFQCSLAVTSPDTLTGLVVFAELTVAIIVPFFFAGVVVALALTRTPFPIGRVYAFDLAGAAAGCLAVLGLINLTDGPSALLWVAALAELAAILFAGSAIGVAPAPLPLFGGQLLRPAPLFVLLALLALANGLTPAGLQPLVVKGQIEAVTNPPIFVRWNSFSRIAVFNWARQPPHMWGPSPTLDGEKWAMPQRSMNIDGDAATVSYPVAGDLARAGFLKYDVTNLAQYLPGHKSAAVIGVGAGRDILSARVFGVPRITGVEINPILTYLLTTAPDFSDYSGINRLPGITYNVDEARSWFARSRDRFDIIQMSLVDTFAATGAGAFTLSENGLYTIEGWQIFLSHLNPGGVFTVSRWYGSNNTDEAGRIVSLAVAALLRLGEREPSRHLFLASSGNIATLIVSRSPFRAEDLTLLHQVADTMKYQVMLSPDGAPASPVLGRIAASRSEAALAQATADLALDMSPPTDERPFFFNQLKLFAPWRAIAQQRAIGGVGTTLGNIAAAKTLLILFLLSLALVIPTVVLPLRPAIADVGRRLAIAGTAYFALIGAGFMCAEIGLLQRLSIFLGHPIYSLSIVLASLILTAGIGSLISDRLQLRAPRWFVLWCAMTALYLFALPYFLPAVLHSFEAAGLLARAAICIVTIAPAGLLMGQGFPTGMRLIAAVDGRPTPWFWGINGAVSVLASVFAVAVSIAFGIYVTLFAAAFCYAALSAAGLAIGFRQRTSAPTLVAPALR
jgi:hypothetical protein